MSGIEDNKKFDYTVEEVFDLEESVYKTPSKMLINDGVSFQLRTEIEKNIQSDTIRYVCAACRQPVKLGACSMQDRRRIHFYHLHKNKQCLYKEKRTNKTKSEIKRLKYNGCHEGKRHLELKEEIASKLSITPGVGHIQIEKSYKGLIKGKWKKPDIQFQFQNQSFVLELQLSTTFLEEIVKRDEFYKENGVSILWVFDSFSTEHNQQLFTQKDVYYQNKRNVFVYDQESRIDNSGFRLSCYYQTFQVSSDGISENWEQERISLNNLNIDLETFKPYYKNCDAWKDEVEREYEEIQNEIIRKPLLPLFNRYLKKIRKPFDEPDLTPGYDYKLCEELNEIDNHHLRSMIHEKLNLNGSQEKYFDILKEAPGQRLFALILNLQFITFNPTLLKSGKTFFIELIERMGFYESQQVVMNLFRTGYVLKDVDHEFLRKRKVKPELDGVNFSENSLLGEKFIIECYNRVPTSLVSKVNEIKRALWTFESIKRKRVLGWDYPNDNYLATVDRIAQRDKQFIDLLINAMEVFGFQHVLNDKKKKSIQKLFRNRGEMTPANDETSVIHCIYPELLDV